MPSYQGQTDSILEIRLPSLLVATIIRADVVFLNGEFPVEVFTVYVAEGAPLKGVLKDAEGKILQSFDGKIIGNMFRKRVKLAGIPGGGSIVFEAELPKHELKGRSAPVRVLPAIKVSDAKLTIEDGKASELEVGETLKLEAKIQGAPDGTMANMRLIAERGPGRRIVIASHEVPVQGGKLSLLRIFEMPGDEGKFKSKDILGEEPIDYVSPNILLEAECQGQKAESAVIPFVSFVSMDFKGLSGKATVVSPEGIESKHDVKAGEPLKLKKPKAGIFVLKDFVETDEEGKVVGVVIEETDTVIEEPL